MFNFEVEEKLDLYFDVKFEEESEFDSFEAEKYHVTPWVTPYSWARREVRLALRREITRNLKTTCLLWLEARLAFATDHS